MTQWTEASRRAWIERRQQESMGWRIIHALGSLRLAMLLLITIAVACAAATIYESRFSAKIAKAYVYENPLFLIWLGVLCINLAAATLTRWPWQRKHIGFVITHAGIIILLVGAMVGRLTGFEAGVTLHKGTPTNRLVQNEMMLQVDSPVDRAVYTMPLPMEARPPRPDRPRVVPLPDTDLKLRISEYTEKLAERQVLVAAQGGGPAVELEFASGMMAQTVPIILATTPEQARSNNFFGRAQIELVDSLPDRSGMEAKAQAVAESQVVMMNHAPIVQTHEGEPTGYMILLTREGEKMNVAVHTPSGATKSMEVKEALQQPLQISDDGLTLTVAEYWPDMVMKDGVPTTRSEIPNNPAILVSIHGSRRGTGGGGQPLLEIAVPEAGSVLYQLSRGGSVYSKGAAKLGEAITLGWADWRATINQALSGGRIDARIEPDPQTKEGIPGIHAALVSPKGAEGEAQWLASGQPRMLGLDGQQVRVGFGLKTRQLPFTIELLNFEVPRDEGTETPSNFISTVRFRDMKTAETLDAKAYMNHPASFPPGWWPAMSGQGYKFSQASWNPNDLNETTLQVLHDPGWLLKWIGSLLLCLGIAVMFYFIPRGQDRLKPVRNREPEAVGVLAE